MTFARDICIAAAILILAAAGGCAAALLSAMEFSR